MCQALKFKFLHTSAFDEANLILKATFLQDISLLLLPEDTKILFNFVSFLSHLASFNLFLSTEVSPKDLGLTIILISLKYQHRWHEIFELELLDEREKERYSESA
jgi:hypothetical protein